MAGCLSGRRLNPLRRQTSRRSLISICFFSPLISWNRSMAWTCHGTTNDEMVDKLVSSRIIKSAEVEEAMRKVDRALFTPPPSAYRDSPQPIGHGATISAPHMHAHCMELLRNHMKPGSIVLDVGSGTGYLTAVMAYLVSREGAPGIAVGIEHIGQLASTSVDNVKRIPWAEKMVENGTLTLLQGDGRLGYPQAAPFDCIHVGAAAPRIPPALTEQLKPGGRLLIPVGPEGGPQHLMIVDKDDKGKLHEGAAFGVMYVPLTDAAHQLDSLVGFEVKKRVDGTQINGVTAFPLWGPCLTQDYLQ